MHFEVSKLIDFEVRNAFKPALHNRVEGLQQLMDDEWRLIEQGYVETCEQVLRRVKANSKEWISKEILEQRKVTKNTTNMARMRKQKRDANKWYMYLGLNREVKIRDRRV